MACRSCPRVRLPRAHRLGHVLELACLLLASAQLVAAQPATTTSTSTSCTATSFVITTFTTTSTTTTTVTIPSGCAVDADCDDGDACTTDRCLDPVAGTCSTRRVFCQNGNACDGFETCDPEVGCVPGTPPDCDDGDACTDDFCHLQLGCLHRPFVQLACLAPGLRDCEDGDACTVDACDPATGCVFPPRDCDDGDACTQDMCVPGTGCVHAGLCLDCAPGPLPGCIGAGRAKVAVKEKVAGRERLQVAFRMLAGSVEADDFGDPISGTTSHAICIYDETGDVVADLRVDRAGATCGTSACWRALADAGYRYKDPEGSADGVRTIVARGGSGTGRLIVKARNTTSSAALPTGITARLAGAAAVLVQVHADDGACFGGRVEGVQRADTVVFKASGPAVAIAGTTTSTVVVTTSSSTTSTSTSTTTSTTPPPFGTAPPRAD